MSAEFRSWLIQGSDGVAHAYPDDGISTVAACKNELRDECDHCGRSDDVEVATLTTPRCRRCVEVLTEGKVTT